MNTIKLYNGVEMPQMGYGVYQVSPDECERCVSDALSVGYRLIDTAQAYHNEEGVGNAWRKSGIRREDLFLVSKIWISNYGYEKAKASIDESLRKLQTEYIDLMLLHQPFCDRYGAYRALIDAYREGKLRAIGVSNFFPDHFIDLASNVEIKPMVNQVETHVFCQQKQPQRGVVIIPKSTHKERMAENINIFDFELSADEMARLEALDTRQSLFFDHHDGEVTKMFMGWRGLV